MVKLPSVSLKEAAIKKKNYKLIFPKYFSTVEYSNLKINSSFLHYAKLKNYWHCEIFTGAVVKWGPLDS